jgi:hypothetical protein
LRNARISIALGLVAPFPSAQNWSRQNLPSRDQFSTVLRETLPVDTSCLGKENRVVLIATRAIFIKKRSTARRYTPGKFSLRGKANFKTPSRAEK